MGLQLEPNADEGGAESEGKGPAVTARSFRLAPYSSGIRSFQLAANPFFNRRPVWADIATGKVASNDVKSFRLTTSREAKSFHLS